MKFSKPIVIFTICLSMIGCKSSIKQQNDSIYSRHLQKHIPLTIITTPMPSKKEEMNLIMLNGVNLVEEINAKKIIDSLYKKKLIQPIILVAFDGAENDYGYAAAKPDNEKQIVKFDKFIDDELYTFIKKKVVITKFNTVAVCGASLAAINSFEVVINNDAQFQIVGMFSPNFSTNDNIDGSLAAIEKMRLKPKVSIFLEASSSDSSSLMFKKIINTKEGIKDFSFSSIERNDTSLNKKPTIKNFAAFLLWAFHK